MWVTVKPEFLKPEPEYEQSTELDLKDAEDRVQDPDAPFSIKPEQGCLPPSGSVSFTITFAPALVSL